MAPTAHAEAVFDRIEVDEVVSLAKELVNVPSPTGEEEAVARVVTEYLDDIGIDAVTQVIEPGRANGIGRLPGANEGDGNSLMLNGHLDTSQTGRDEDYLTYGEQSRHRAWRAEAYEEDGRLYGAGMMNDKGPVASFLVAAKAIHEAGIELDGDLVLAAVAGEIGKAPIDEYRGRQYRGHGVGTRYAINSGYRTDFAVVAENSGWGIGWGLPGPLYVKLTVHGNPQYINNVQYDRLTSEHSIHKALEFTLRFREWAEQYTNDNSMEYGGGRIEPVANLGAFRAGLPPKPNYAPGLAQLYFDIRVPPNRDPDDVLAEFTRFVREFDETIDIEPYRSQRGYAPEGDEIDYLVDSVSGAYRSVFESDPPACSTGQNSKWNDVNVLNEHGVTAVKIAPGPGPLDTQLTRRTVTPEDLHRAAKVYAGCALSVCGVVD